MLAILILCISAFVTRYFILRRPVKWWAALLGMAPCWLLMLWLLDGIVGQPIISAATAAAGFILWKGRATQDKAHATVQAHSDSPRELDWEAILDQRSTARENALKRVKALQAAAKRC